jgi:hypothetical protein
MTGNVYGRRMFHMANGGMMPPVDPAMVMAAGAPPGMPPGAPPGMPPGAEMAMGEPPPEVAQMADQVLLDGVQQGVNQEVERSVGNLNAAMDFRDVMNIVWDQDADVDMYRSRLAEVVGPEDASRTPDSVLALVQPTLQLAEIDKGVAGLMKEELAEVGDIGGGLMGLATKSAVADGMAAETGALVNAVGNMSNGGGSMDDMMMAAIQGEMAPGPAPMDQGPMPTDPEMIY